MAASSGNDSIIINNTYGTNIQAGSSAPGRWSGPVETVVVPDPPSVLLFGTALGAILRKVHGSRN
jgi:hypothetical protein